jgi:DNA-binding PadR family transcriptional regulator
MARQLNATAASLLGFLHDGPMSGWDLAAYAEARIGEFWSLTQSQVYRELAKMADEGLVTAGERGTRDKRLFEVTDAGRAAFAAWVDVPPGSETIRFPLLLTLVFGRHVSRDRLHSFLAQHRMSHAERLAAYERQRREIPEGYDDEEPYAVATLEFGISYERAVLDWFDKLPPALLPDQ